MRLIKQKVGAEKDEGVTISYIEWTKQFEAVENYVLGIGKQITVYGQNKEMRQVNIEDILYFEAVGELVFAYTQQQVYEIKMRLYQVEEKLKSDKMSRASKSLVINLKHIDSVRSALNGRLYAKMTNGEEVLISRQYAKAITSQIMNT